MNSIFFWRECDLNWSLNNGQNLNRWKWVNWTWRRERRLCLEILCMASKLDERINTEESLMGSQRVGRDWATELNWTECITCSVPKLYLTLCNSIDCSPPGSSVLGTFQARILKWAASSSSRGCPWCRDGSGISSFSYIGGWILYHWTNWEVLVNHMVWVNLYLNKQCFDTKLFQQNIWH